MSLFLTINLLVTHTHTHGHTPYWFYFPIKPDNTITKDIFNSNPCQMVIQSLLEHFPETKPPASHGSSSCFMEGGT